MQWGDHGGRIKDVRATVERFPYLTDPRNSDVDTATLTPTLMTNTTRPPAPAGFDLIGEASFTDPAGLFATIRDESPVFFYPPISRWIVSRREDVERWITDFATFSNSGNFDPTTVPEAYRHRVAPDLLVQGMVSLDPPDHTVRRKVAQRGFTRGHMRALEPEIVARAHGSSTASRRTARATS